MGQKEHLIKFLLIGGPRDLIIEIIKDKAGRHPIDIAPGTLTNFLRICIEQINVQIHLACQTKPKF